MLRFLSLILGACLAFAAPAAQAQGTLPVALSQQVDSNGRPLVGALLYTYVVGTVASPQFTFQDSGLTQQNPWPLSADQNGRIPMFYMASGSTHARLTDSTGVSQFDYPSMLVIGSAGGGGGGGTVDPTTIASTGDIKFRGTSEVLTGWVRLNGQTIGSAVSGATGRANNDTQSLFVYLWNNCTNAHCAVISGRGGSATADFSANKQITLPDWRARGPIGLNDMGSTNANIIQSTNITSGGGDTGTTPGAFGGEAVHAMATTELPPYTPAGTVAVAGSLSGDSTNMTVSVADTHTHNYLIAPNRAFTAGPAASGNSGAVWEGAATGTQTTGTIAGSITASLGINTVALHLSWAPTTQTFTGSAQGGTSSSANRMAPFILGSWHIKL